MQDAISKAAKQLIPANYVDSGIEGGLNPHEKAVRSLLSQRRCPPEGLSDVAVVEILNRLSLMDSNNFPSHTGAGEREGRVLSRLVAARHYYMSHGIGRSGNLTEAQPKAAGSSIIYQLTNAMVLDVLRHLCSFEACESCVVVPMATGMTLSLVLRTIASQRPPTAKFVVWPRIDQRTCLKCVQAAGFVPFPIALRSVTAARPDGGPPQPTGFWRVDAADVEAAIRQIGAENVVCVLSTTSCFAPRVPDDPLPISRVCSALDVPYVINNAYGLQSTKTMKRINAASVHGRVDALVQSTDKNFLVPVGGAVVAGRKVVVRSVCDMYAGRASASPIVDVFMTLLGCGRDGFQSLLSERYTVLEYFLECMKRFAAEKGEDLLICDENDISFVLTMRSFTSVAATGKDDSDGTSDSNSGERGGGGSSRSCGGPRGGTQLGAMLFRQCVSGPKVIVPGKTTTLCGAVFHNYGMHSDELASSPPLLVVACAIGMTKHEVDRFCATLRELWV